MRTLFTILLVFNTLFTNAQDSLVVKETSKLMSLGSKNAYSINIPQAKIKEVISDWKKYLRQKNKSSINENKGEYELSKTIIQDISNDSIIIYSVFTGNPDSVQLFVFVSGKDSAFYSSSSTPEVSTKIKTYIRNFGVNQYRNAVTDELALEQKKLKQLETDLQDLEDENEKSEKKINANKRENERTEDDIKSNLDELKVNSSALTQQKQLVATYIDKSDLKTAEEKKLKELEKEKKKLQKKNESLHEDIEDKESENKSIQKTIDQNNSENIPAKKTEIEKQKHVIQYVDTKMKGIR